MMQEKIKKIILALKQDKNVIEVARGTLLAFIWKGIGASLSFTFNILVARLLGTDGAGQYFLALSVTSIGSIIGRMGLDNALLKYIAMKAATNDWAEIRGVYSLGMRIAIVSSLIITLILYCAAPWLAVDLFKKPELIEPLQWMTLSILPFAIINLQAESLKGLVRIRDAMILQSISVPLISIILLVPLVELSKTIGASAAYLAGTIITSLVGMWAWTNAMVDKNKSFTPFLFKRLWESCRPLFIVSLMNDGIRAWAPIFLLGIWSTTDDVGIFGAAMRIVALTTFMLFAVNNVLAPKLAELYAKRNMSVFASTARRSAGIIALLASPIFIVLILAADDVMGIYGREFINGGIVLSILVVGQVANVFTGPLGVILIVTGNETYAQNTTFLWTTILLLLLFILIPFFGAIGAALAISISGTGLSLKTAVYVHRSLGINAIPFASAFRGINKKNY